MGGWSDADIPPQSGKVAIVTGATGGLGYETTRALAKKGATAILAGRNRAKGQEAVSRICTDAPDANIRFESLDLADFASIRDFAGRVVAAFPHIDILVNNAGVAMVPERQTTRDGFELQLGTNYLGHFLLTSLLLPALLRARAPRVISLSSLGHRMGPMDFDDLQGERRYSPGKAYGQSKLAMLLFAQELQRISQSKGWKLLSMPVHPGVSESNLMTAGPKVGRGRVDMASWIADNIVIPLMGQSTAQGALPTLYAATAPQAKGGQYYGPAGWLEFKGSPGPAKMAAHAQDPAVAEKLWAVSVRMTGANWSPD